MGGRKKRLETSYKKNENKRARLPQKDQLSHAPCACVSIVPPALLRQRFTAEKTSGGIRV